MQLSQLGCLWLATVTDTIICWNLHSSNGEQSDDALDTPTQPHPHTIEGVVLTLYLLSAMVHHKGVSPPCLPACGTTLHCVAIAGRASGPLCAAQVMPLWTVSVCHYDHDDNDDGDDGYQNHTNWNGNG